MNNSLKRAQQIINNYNQNRTSTSCCCCYGPTGPTHTLLSESKW